MSKQQNNTKKGAAAIYIVIFTATLLGIVTLSFVRLMLAESMRTTNYSLSQSAYNSALAGIEDAKVVLLRYQNCVNSGSTFTSGVECDDYVDSFDSLNSATNAEDCDLVRHLLGYDTEYNEANHETLIQTNTSDTISSAGAAFDQAYTCVKINQKSSNYLTTLTENYPTKIVPIRTGNSDNPSDNDHVNQIDRIVISWFNRKNVDKVSLDGALDTNNYRSPQYGENITSANFNSFIAFSDANTNPYYNTFGDPSDPSTLPIAPPTIQMTFIQTAEAFKLSQFYSNSGNATNRGTLTLRPVNKASGVTTIESTHINKTSGGLNAIAASANKSQNAPIDVVCDTTNEELEYACTADITIPSPKTGFQYQRTAKVKEHYRKYDDAHPYSYSQYDVDVCSEIESDGRNCKSTKTISNVQINDINIKPQDPGTRLDAVSGGNYTYDYDICLAFNPDGTCKSKQTKHITNGTTYPSSTISLASVQNSTPINRYTFQICTVLTNYITCQSGSTRTVTYEGTAAPKAGSALKYTRANNKVTYYICEEWDGSTGNCKTYSSTAQTYDGRAPSSGLTGPQNTTTAATGRSIYRINRCTSLSQNATCSFTTDEYTGTKAPSGYVTIHNMEGNGKYKVNYCSGFKAADGTCSNWTLTTSGGSTLYYIGPSPRPAATNIQRISSPKHFYKYTYVTCNESYGYATNGECNRWNNTKYTEYATSRPEEYRTVTRTQTIAASNRRNPNTTFIVLNAPYGIPETEVSVQLLHCGSDTADISTCRSINFANVQPIIDSTGRANDLFRRVEARIELVDTYFPIANFALAADDDNSDNDNIKKDFYVTKGCSYTESYPTANSVTYTSSTSCKDAGDRSSGVAPSMNP